MQLYIKRQENNKHFCDLMIRNPPFRDENKFQKIYSKYINKFKRALTELPIEWLIFWFSRSNYKRIDILIYVRVDKKSQIMFYLEKQINNEGIYNNIIILNNCVYDKYLINVTYDKYLINFTYDKYVIDCKKYEYIRKIISNLCKIKVFLPKNKLSQIIINILVFNYAYKLKLPEIYDVINSIIKKWNGVIYNEYDRTYVTTRSLKLINKKQIEFSLILEEEVDNISILIKNKLNKWIYNPDYPYALLVKEVDINDISITDNGNFQYEVILSFYMMNIGLFENDILPHIDILNAYNSGRWNKNELRDYAKEYWNITNIKNPIEIYDELTEIIHSDLILESL